VELGTHALGLAPLEGKRGFLRRHLLLLRLELLRRPSLALSRRNELLTHTTHLRLEIVLSRGRAHSGRACGGGHGLGMPLGGAPRMLRLRERLHRLRLQMASGQSATGRLADGCVGALLPRGALGSALRALSCEELGDLALALGVLERFHLRRIHGLPHRVALRLRRRKARLCLQQALERAPPLGLGLLREALRLRAPPADHLHARAQLHRLARIAVARRLLDAPELSFKRRLALRRPH
jgi:hypothetical protein